MKQLLTSLRSAAMLTISAALGVAWLGEAQAQTDLPYVSGSTGLDGPLTFRTIPVGGRYGHAMAYDIVRSQTIVFGGYLNAYLADTWTFDGTNWTKLSPQASPPPRSGARMVYVPWNGGRLILFGGVNQNGNLNDTWSWDGTNWTQINTAVSPAPRSSSAMVYDAERNNIMLFSGTGNGVTTDVWLLDGVSNPLNWRNINPPNPPPNWDQHIAAFDAERKLTVLVSYLGTHLWNGTNWTTATPLDPVPRSGHGGIAYDPVHKEVVVFGGEAHNHTYVWNGSNWAARNPSTILPTASSTEMVFDAARSRIMIFGGQTATDTYSADTWAWDGINWSFVSGKNQTFDMSARANGIWNFTTINIPSGLSIYFKKNSANTPVRWLATGNVQIDGSLVLDGSFGDNNLPEGVGGAGGPGGFSGGHGGIRLNRSGSYVGSPGQGPGGGLPGTHPSTDRDGKNGAYAGAGGYGNIYLQPLTGGSGGGGGASSDTIDGGNGSGGGGAILIASSKDIVVNGGVYSRGGANTYSGASYGGRGTGGSILLRGDRISGAGSIDATPDGRIRFEAYYRTLAGSTQPTSVNSAPVSSTDYNAVGTLSIQSVKGINVAQPPTGNTLTPDVIFTDAGPVTVVVQGTSVPDGTPVQLRIATINGVITPAAQNMTGGTATFNVTVPKGIGTLQAFATFTINN
jgi:hypothetical protein